MWWVSLRGWGGDAEGMKSVSDALEMWSFARWERGPLKPKLLYRNYKENGERDNKKLKDT